MAYRFAKFVVYISVVTVFLGIPLMASAQQTDRQAIDHPADMYTGKIIFDRNAPDGIVSFPVGPGSTPEEVELMVRQRALLMRAILDGLVPNGTIAKDFMAQPEGPGGVPHTVTLASSPDGKPLLRDNRPVLVLNDPTTLPAGVWAGDTYTVDVSSALLTDAPTRSADATGGTGFSLDRAMFMTSTDWYLIDNFPGSGLPDGLLIFRRFYAVDVGGNLVGGLANTISFVCQRGHPNYLLVHLPEEASIKTIDRSTWISQAELRVRADNFTTRFTAEFNNGDFFIDFADDSIQALTQVLNSKNVMIEFGPGDERLSLYAGDVSANGKGNLKELLRAEVPTLMKTVGGKNVRAVDIKTMFSMCDQYRMHTSVDGTGGVDCDRC